jgi:hypothetical protein
VGIDIEPAGRSVDSIRAALGARDFSVTWKSRQKRLKMFGVIAYNLVNIGSAFSYTHPAS